MKLLYVGGPLDGQTYPLSVGQPAPLAIRRNEWKGQGHYVFRSASGPDSPKALGQHLAWVGK